jgi:hypothetical protein
MDLEKLFDLMEAGGIGRPENEGHLHSYAPWYSISRAIIRGRPQREIVGNIPFIAQTMGHNRQHCEAKLAAWERKAAEAEYGKDEDFEFMSGLPG